MGAVICWGAIIIIYSAVAIDLVWWHWHLRRLRRRYYDREKK